MSSGRPFYAAGVTIEQEMDRFERQTYPIGYALCGALALWPAILFTRGLPPSHLPDMVLVFLVIFAGFSFIAMFFVDFIL